MLNEFLAAIMIFGTSVNTGGMPDSLRDNYAEYSGKIISGIKIVRYDVFDDKIGDDTPFYYRWGNALHIKTRENVIRDELLFSAGEPVDTLRILESQRNLRLRGFIGEVYVTAAPNGPDSVDLTVSTIDYWTTKISLFTELGGGKYSLGAAASEINFLGNGQAVEISGQTGNDNDSYSFYLADGRIGGSRFAGSVYYLGTSFGNNIFLSFARPQYSLRVKTGYDATYQSGSGTIRVFDSGDERFRYRRNYNIFDSRVLYSIGRLNRLDLFAKYNYSSRDYSPYYDNSPLNHTIPVDQTRSYPSFGLGAAVIRYIMQRYLDEAGTPEDLTLGATIRISLGRSLPQFGGDYPATRPEFSASFLANPLGRIFIGSNNRLYWWRYDGQSREIRSRSETMLYVKTGPTQVLSARWLTDFAWRQISNYQLILGGSNGLRGYPAYEFAGDRLAVGNVEYRFYIPVEILTVRLGGAAFFDIGRAWRRGEKIDPGDLRSDVGVGLRFGLTRSSTSRVLRLDLAKSLSSNDVFVSFGSTVLFSLKIFNSND